jgi:hypothetical protein
MNYIESPLIILYELNLAERPHPNGRKCMVLVQLLPILGFFDLICGYGLETLAVSLLKQRLPRSGVVGHRYRLPRRLWDDDLLVYFAYGVQAHRPKLLAFQVGVLGERERAIDLWVNLLLTLEVIQ